MKNLGKRFEENFKLSVPENLFFYRFRDTASSYYGGNNNLRFSSSNIADCLIQDPTIGLLLIELKSHKGKSIPLSCIVGTRKGDKLTTKEKQMFDLRDANNYVGVYAYLIVFFSDIEECYSLDIEKFMEFYYLSCLGERKSIPISYFEENGKEIEVKKLKTNHRFCIDKWLNDLYKEKTTK